MSLSFLSNRRGIAAFGAAIFLVFFAAGTGLRYALPLLDAPGQSARLHSNGQTTQAEQILADYLRKSPDDEDAWRQLARQRGQTAAALSPEKLREAGHRNPIQPHGKTWPVGSPFYMSTPTYEDFIRTSPLPERLLTAWFLGEAESAEAGIAALKPDPAQALDQTEAGDIYKATGDMIHALACYERALALQPTDPENRRDVLHAVLDLQMKQNFLERMEDSANWKAADDTLLVEYYRANRDYVPLFWPLVREQIAAYSPVHLAAALAAGVAWFVFLVMAGRLATLRGLGAGVAALVLGAMSTQVVVFLSAVTDDLIGFESREKTLVFDFLYAVLAIGVREELVKLVFFAPLALLIRRFTPLEVISVASMVGLGFAVEENIGYFHSAGGSAVAARFLSANFLHLSLTGYAGYMLVTALAGSKTGARNAWSEFSSALVNVMFFHGLYDFFIIDQSMQSFWFLSTVVLVWTTREYLRTLTSLRLTQARVPLSAVFVGALAVSAGTGFVLLSQEVGILLGLLELFAGILGLAIIAVVFFREIDERLA